MGSFKAQKFDVSKYIGKEFDYGRQDCYTLLINYYRDELGVKVPKIENLEGWWDRGENLYVDSMQEAGYISVPFSDLQENDILLIKLFTSVPSHAAIYVGDNHILHHAVGRLSTLEPLKGMWIKNIHTIARYVGNVK